MAQNVTVTIGRNYSPQRAVGDAVGAMPAWRWQDFRGDVRAAVEAHTDDVYVDADYTGTWGDVEEDAHVWLGQLREGTSSDTLRARLRALAVQYGQDAIGVTIGFGSLVGPDDEPF